MKAKRNIFSTVMLLVVFLAGSGTKAQTSFPCGSELYISNSDKLYKYAPNGSETYLFDVGNINALAFSTNNLIWAFDQDAQKVVIIDADGNKNPITIDGLPVGSADYNVGTIDANGYYYLYYGEANARFYIIDTDPSRSTYGKLVNPLANGGVVPYPEDTRSPKGTPIQPAANGGVNRRTISDWTVSPIDGKLYAMTNSTSVFPYNIVRYDPVNGAIETVTTSPITGDNIRNSTSGTSYGAIFMDIYGHLFIFANQQGHLYSIDIENSSATQISTTAISSNNIDGANCILSDDDISMPVTFGNVSALIKGKQLLVHWSTFAETNNDHFEIEASADGTTFTKIGEVISKAENGNSDTPLDYEFQASLSGSTMAKSGIGFALLALIGFALFGNNRKAKSLFAGLMLTGILMGAIGCQKQGAESLDGNGINTYIRIKQVDKDGTASYSKIIKVVNK